MNTTARITRAPVPSPRRAFMARALLGLCGVVALCAASMSAAQAAPAVPVVAARMAKVGAGMTLEGGVQAVRSATVAAQASGRVLQLHVKAGDVVRAGQRLVSVDGREAQAQVARSEADLAQAQAQLSNARAQAERTRSLRTQGFVSQAAVDVAEAQYQAALAGRAAASAGRTQTAVARGHAEISAPFDGVVSQTFVEAGDLALPGKPLLAIYAPQALRVVVHVPSSRLPLARQATRIEVRLADGRWVLPLRSAALPTADAVSQTTEWRLDLDAATLQSTPAPALIPTQPGQPVRVRFVGAEEDALVIPAQAVLRRGELTAVYVAATKPAQGFVLRAVRLGSRQGAAGVEVAAGLKAGELVATDPVAAGLAAAQSAAHPARQP